MLGPLEYWIFLLSLIISHHPVIVGGRLFSKLHKLRTEKAKEHPECFTSGQHSIKLRTSYTSPNISTDYQHNTKGGIPEKLSDESPDTDFPTSWDETQQRVESCGTHSYIEETGCLQNTRSAASFFNKLDRLSLHSGPTRTRVNARIHPPAPSLCLHSSETQEKPALPLSCTRVSQALDVMSELQTKKTAVGLMECSSQFEQAWKAADPAQNCGKINPYALTDSKLENILEQASPHTNQTSFLKAGPANNDHNHLSSSPAILHLPLHCQTQIRGRASWDTNGCNQGSVFISNSADTATDPFHDNSSPTSDERNGIVVIRSTDRSVFSEHSSETPWSCSTSLQNSMEEKRGISSGRPLPLSGLNFKQETSLCEVESMEDACELLSHTEKLTSAKERSFVGWFNPPGNPPMSTEDKDASFKPVKSEGDDQIIEVDGWCHLPRIPQKAMQPKVQAMKTCWGLPEAEVCVWGAQILLALESLHQQGILCRDLNPRNVLLTNNGTK